MFKREILKELEEWAIRPGRKPLVLRGARQVGKTTLVNEFSKKFEQYIYLNLELPEDRRPFEQFSNIETLVQTLFFIRNLSLQKKNKTLIFIDEIQVTPRALNILRFFLESEPEIAVIAAGSLLETLFDKNISFPVGRVEYLMVRPASFPEFLNAMGETTALEQLSLVPIAPFTHPRLLQLFHTYALIGGMPEVVNHYSMHRDLTSLSRIFDSLLASYLDDVEKYAISNAQVLHIRHAINSSFTVAGKRIKFEGFGNSTYRSRDMSEALRILEKALLLHLIYPCTNAMMPLVQDIRKSPRLQLLDTGLLNYVSGMQTEISLSNDLHSAYKGTVLEHLVGQELMAMKFHALSRLNFWVREKKTSSAEVDYLYSFEGKIIPVEVKSGKEGKLKSLQLFMDESPQNLAVRFNSNMFSISDSITTQGKKFHLINIPYYLVSKIDSYLKWFIENQKQDSL